MDIKSNYVAIVAAKKLKGGFLSLHNTKACLWRSKEDMLSGIAVPTDVWHIDAETHQKLYQSGEVDCNRTEPEDIVSIKCLHPDYKYEVTLSSGRKLVAAYCSRMHEKGYREYSLRGDKGGLNAFGTFSIGLTENMFMHLHSMKAGDVVLSKKA